MPRYFFDLAHDGSSRSELEGVVLPDEMAAWKEATLACGEMISDLDGQLQPGTEWRMVVSDEEGPLFVLNFWTEHLR